MSLPTERPMANNFVTRFFGGPPLSVIFRLILLSILVGVILKVLGLDPFNIIRSIEDLIRFVWDLGFDAVRLAVAVFPARRGDRGADLADRAADPHAQGAVIPWSYSRFRRSSDWRRPRHVGHASAVMAAASVPTSSSRPAWRAAAQLVRKIGLDAGDQPQSVEDQRAVELDEACARPYFGQRRFARIDAADADERERALDPNIGLRQHAGREREERSPGQPARLAAPSPARAASAAAPAWCCR